MTYSTSKAYGFRIMLFVQLFLTEASFLSVLMFGAARRGGPAVMDALASRLTRGCVRTIEAPEAVAADAVGMVGEERTRVLAQHWRVCVIAIGSVSL